MLWRLVLTLSSVLAITSYAGAQSTRTLEIDSGTTAIHIFVDPDAGNYGVENARTGWKFSGDLGSPATRAAIRKGRDAVGSYSEIDFSWNQPTPMNGVIRSYDDQPIVWCRAHYAKSVSGNGIDFPDFKSINAGARQFSYQDRTFSPPIFGLSKTSTPWLFFDDSARSLVISPASNFMVATMDGDGRSEMGVGLGTKVSKVPAGFDQDCLIVFADGIGVAWDRWGSTMQKLFHKQAPANDADVILRKFGYWTDNGADYYYNYDPGKGYADTLVGLVNTYREEGIPLGYLQLDSWWYQKSTYDPAGKPGGAKKNNRLPIGSWNRYGGLMEYRAHPDLFRGGLSNFEQALGLPLAVHNRWIDRMSPYHDKYKISGVGAIDPNWWKDTVGYLKNSGVVCYEQDWLDEIYLNSPEMASTVGIGDAFTDGMADACSRAGLSMQYCMGTPRFFLQGLKYSNLTTIRTSGDRFEPRKWANFLYVSRLAHDVGIWPWCDVFKSAETGNMILSVLSAGPVGTGDAIGKEGKENILMAVRPDGVIVKPDQPLLPCDRTYLEAAAKKQTPFLASTFTDHKGVRTTYAILFPRPKGDQSARVKPSDFGVKKGAYVFDFMTGKGRHYNPNDEFTVSIGKDGYAYLMFASDTQSRVVLLGDLAKYVPTGKQRISEIEDKPEGIKIMVKFAKGEQSVYLDGVAPKSPSIHPTQGSAKITAYDAAAGRFTIQVQAGQGSTAEILLGK